MAFVGGNALSFGKSLSGPSAMCARSAFGGQQLQVASSASGRAAVRMDVVVSIEDGENIEGALRRFKREVIKSGHLMEIRSRKQFVSNTEKRIKNDALSRRRQRIAKNQREQ